MSEVGHLTLPPLTGPQIRIFRIDECPERCWDVEGAPRSAKSWGVAIWIWKLAWTYPGIRIFYCRYKDDDLKSLKEVWGLVTALFPAYLHPKWNSQDESWDFPNGTQHGEVYSGSRVILSSLRVSEAMTADAIHGKYKGKTIAVVVCEEAQEIPYENYRGLKERLSQTTNPLGQKVSYPLKIVLVHNAVDEDHWICKEFPLDDSGKCTKEGHAHIRSDLYSNECNLGPVVMAGYEQDYPVGHPLRKAVVEGKRGTTMMGKPVYEGLFDRAIHIDKGVEYHPAYPILEGWDFGNEKPCVSWWQYLTHLGKLQLLGAVKGSEMYLESFSISVLSIRTRLFPGVPKSEFWTWCDPTGATGNQGMQHTAVRHIQSLGLSARYDAGSNRADIRYGAIQVIAGFLSRTARDGSPALQMVPHIVELVKQGGNWIEKQSELHIAAFQTGYIWDEHAAPDGQPNIRKPKKGTRYDDFMNTLEYVVIGEKISVPQHGEMWNADRRVASTMERIAKAAVAGADRHLSIGPTGETLNEAMGRIARLQKLRPPDRDPMDRRVVSFGRRGGY